MQYNELQTIPIYSIFFIFDLSFFLFISQMSYEKIMKNLLLPLKVYCINWYVSNIS